jgi:hypothetical protein
MLAMARCETISPCLIAIERSAKMTLHHLEAASTWAEEIGDVASQEIIDWAKRVVERRSETSNSTDE